MLYFHIISLFPESIEPYLQSSLLGRAQQDGLIKVRYYNPRDYTKDKHKRVDNKPYGGGPGMVLEAPSFLRAVRHAIGTKRNVEVIFFTPGGEQFTNEYARELADMQQLVGKRVHAPMRHKHIVLLCARYEGLDARVPQALGARRVSVGPYVLTGGELPAAIVVDATARWVDGVLGDSDSREEERGSVASDEVYTRPETVRYNGGEYAVPSVLLSGNHAEIERWRSERKSGIL